MTTPTLQSFLLNLKALISLDELLGENIIPILIQAEMANSPHHFLSSRLVQNPTSPTRVQLSVTMCMPSVEELVLAQFICPTVLFRHLYSCLLAPKGP
jgi:hypothetical protein